MARLVIREVTFQLLSDIFFETKFPVFTMRERIVCVCVRERDRERERETDREKWGFASTATALLCSAHSVFLFYINSEFTDTMLLAALFAHKQFYLS